MFYMHGEHSLRFESVVTVRVPTLEGRRVVMSVETVLLRSLDASSLRVLNLMRMWLEASDVVVCFLAEPST